MLSVNSPLGSHWNNEVAGVNFSRCPQRCGPASNQSTILMGYAMKLKATLLVLTVLLLATAARADAPEAPFKSAAAIQAYNKYHYEMSKARQTYERDTAAARSTYLSNLGTAAEVMAKAGDSAELKRIADEQNDIKEMTGKASPSRLVGRWSIATRRDVWVEFHDDGSVGTFTGRDTGLWRSNDDTSLTTIYGPGVSNKFHVFTLNSRNKATSEHDGDKREWVRVK